ncbi:MAG: OmpA family protein [Bacteroidota bacterium]
MKKISILLLTLSSALGSMAQSDKKDCEDHPIVTRYPGAIIEYCDIQIYKEYGIATGPETGYKKISDWIKVAGKNTRIYYSIKGDRTVSEVYKNYLQAMKEAEFDILANKLHGERNVSKDVGGNGWLNTFYSTNSFPSSVGIKLNQGSATIGGTFHIAGKLNNVYVAVSGKQYTDKEVVILLDVIEEGEVEDDFIKVDADYMAKKLLETGRVALQGILFDFDKATIKKESEPLLAEIAKMLKANPSFKLYVVGHTDMKGALQYNLELSSKRAPAVVDYLVENHQISKERLSPQAVGPLAPVATSGTEEGRRKNRRVELVLINK